MIALLVGRWQPLHRGHTRLLDSIMNRFERTVVGVGSSGKSRTSKNPLTFEERKAVIRACYPNIEVFPVKDREKDDRWMSEVEERLVEMGIENPREKVVCISMDGWTRKCLSDAGYEVESYELIDPERFSGTNIRRKAKEGGDWRFLVPDCALEKLEKFGFEEILEES